MGVKSGLQLFLKFQLFSGTLGINLVPMPISILVSINANEGEEIIDINYPLEGMFMTKTELDICFTYLVPYTWTFYSLTFLLFTIDFNSS